MSQIEEIQKAIKETLESFFPQRTEWVDKPEAKKLLGIKSDTTLYELRDSNEIRYTRHGRIFLYDRDSIAEFLEKFANYDKSAQNR